MFTTKSWRVKNSNKKRSTYKFSLWGSKKEGKGRASFLYSLTTSKYRGGQWVEYNHNLLKLFVQTDRKVLPQFMTDCAVLCLVAQLCPTLCDPMDCSSPGSSALRILQARILECVCMPSSRESSQPRNRTGVSSTAGGFFPS